MTDANKTPGVPVVSFSNLDTQGAVLIVRVMRDGKVNICSPMGSEAVKAALQQLAEFDYQDPKKGV